MALLLDMKFFLNGMRLTLATSDVYYLYYACYHAQKKKKPVLTQKLSLVMSLVYMRHTSMLPIMSASDPVSTICMLAVHGPECETSHTLELRIFGDLWPRNPQWVVLNAWRQLLVLYVQYVCIILLVLKF